MSYTLGSKAKFAITNSLGKLNQTFRMSSFPSSPGAYSGVIANQSTWSAMEKRVWLVVLFVGMALLHSNRMALPFSLNEISELGGWKISTKSHVLGSFYWGYMVAPLLSHHLSSRYGGEKVQWLAAIVWSLCLPLAVQMVPYSQVMLLSLQFIRGLTQGFHVPALLSIISRKCPEDSRMFLFSILLSGTHVGSGMAGAFGFFSASHNMNHSSSYLGLFLLVSVAGLIWALLVKYLLQRSAKNHKTYYKLSESVHLLERGDVNRNRNIVVGGVRGGGREQLKLEVQPPTRMIGSMTSLPWRKALRNPPVIVLFVSHFSLSLFIHMAMTWLPSYWTSSYQSHVVLWNVLPWVAMALGSAGASWISQWQASRNNNHTLIRGILTCLCLGGSAIFLVLTSLAAHTHSTLHLMSTICVCAFHGLSSGCTLLNPLDLAPPSYWGVLFSAMETVGGMAGVLSVHVTGVAMTWFNSPNLVLVLYAVVDAIALIFYVTFGGGKRLQFDAT